MAPARQEFSRTLAWNLIYFRKCIGKNQDEVAKEIAIPRATLCRLEGGLGNPSLKVILQLAHYYKISVNDLLMNRTNNRILKGQGHVEYGRLSEDIQFYQTVSHDQHIWFREVKLPKEAMIRIPSGERMTKELVICKEGEIYMTTPSDDLLLKKDEYAEVHAELAKKIHSLDCESRFIIIRVKSKN